jgi:2-iminobutanoate/2-iminopropanoate deaminase
MGYARLAHQKRHGTSAVKKTIINPEAGKGWSIFEGSGVNQLIHSDAVKIELSEATLVYVSGKTATDSNGQVVGPGNIKTQTSQVLKNISHILAEAGGTIDHVVRVRVYVRSPLRREMFCQIHEERAEVFKKEHYPASTMVIVDGLVREGALIEIDAEAVIPKT